MSASSVRSISLRRTRNAATRADSTRSKTSVQVFADDVAENPAEEADVFAQRFGQCSARVVDDDVVDDRDGRTRFRSPLRGNGVTHAVEYPGRTGARHLGEAIRRA